MPNSESKSEPATRAFSWKVGLATAAGVVAFLLVFRPFGVEADTKSEKLAILGLAPVLFGSLMLLHYFLLPAIKGGAAARRAVAIMVIVAVVFGYLKTVAHVSFMGLVGPVVLLVGLAMTAVWLVLQRRELRSEVIELRGRSMPEPGRQLVFSGDDGKQIVRIGRSALRFAKAEGNYVVVHWYADGTHQEELLRARLSDIERMADGALIQCHRSYLVNLDAADRVEGPLRSTQIAFPEGVKIPVSRSRATGIRKLAKESEPGATSS